ncbi:methyltransferase domain-containing protein [Paenibacillus tengchongensis]|uniref:methyltransferase domain-containing protein n=1 Tax=Paenibacillus tengchongensis TaxID=2608684 RepID=UPI00124E977E|nr:methyltransferase domain-containing protein [Paenibacillus tengchongensis]
MDRTAAFSNSLEAYLHYTRMPWGRLFYETAWHQIDGLMTGEKQTLLDIGCGFGLSSNEYSRRGFRVTGLEPTRGMLELAAAGGQPVRFINTSFQAAAAGLGRYDRVFCHNILEYVDDPAGFIRLIGGCQEAGGCLSLIAHNPAAKVLKKAIMLKQPAEALAGMGSDKEYSGIIGTDITVYSCEQLTEWLRESGYKVAGHFGIHNVYGYIADNELKHDDAWHEQMKQLEFGLGGQSPYRDIAVFTHLIARKVE